MRTARGAALLPSTYMPGDSTAELVPIAPVTPGNRHILRSPEGGRPAAPPAAAANWLLSLSPVARLGSGGGFPELDSGVLRGWSRTDGRLTVYTTGSPNVGTVGLVWRFHGLASAGIDSHFFAASPAVRTAMEGTGWIREGQGPGATIMCSPTGSAATSYDAVMDAWLTPLLDALALPQYGLSTLFVVALVSATLLPVGSEPALFGLVKLNPELFWPAIVVATIGNTAGGAITWWMGYGAELAYERVTHHRHGTHSRALAWLERFGPPACLLSWLPLVGDPLCAVAGWLRLPFWPCLVYMAIGKFARYVTMTVVLLWIFPGGFLR